MRLEVIENSLYIKGKFIFFSNLKSNWKIFRDQSIKTTTTKFPKFLKKKRITDCKNCVSRCLELKSRNVLMSRWSGEMKIHTNILFFKKCIKKGGGRGEGELQVLLKPSPVLQLFLARRQTDKERNKKNY